MKAGSAVRMSDIFFPTFAAIFFFCFFFSATAEKAWSANGRTTYDSLLSSGAARDAQDIDRRRASCVASTRQKNETTNLSIDSRIELSG
jgi:hypothetical protein